MAEHPPTALDHRTPPPPGASPPHDSAPSPAPPQAPISRLLTDICTHFPGETITLGHLATLLGDRAFGLLILVLGLPAFLPGIASVFGLPILVLGLQMGLGMKRPRLPGFLARQEIKRSALLSLAGKSSRWLAKVEGLVRPRPGFWVGARGDRVVGWLTAYAAILIILPGPGTNGPPTFGAMVMALGVIEHDNRTIGIGIILSILANLFATGMLIAVFWLGVTALNWLI